jgi:hypothetical protein
MKYRSKPIVVEAFQWTGDAGQTEDPMWIVKAMNAGKVAIRRRQIGGNLYMNIETQTGKAQASPGDWIIKGADGEIHPCKPEVFAATYELAE